MRVGIQRLCLILAIASGAIAFLSASVFDFMELWAVAFLIFLPTGALSVLFYLLIPLVRVIIATVQESARERALRPPPLPSRSAFRRPPPYPNVPSASTSTTPGSNSAPLKAGA